MIESIITDYMQHNRRLVIPDLGAFLRKEGGEVVFVPFLNKDDGVLSGLVSQAYGTSSSEAQEIIARYADNILEGIEANGAFLVYPMGSLKKDPNGLLYLDAMDLNSVAKAVEKEIPVEEEVVIQSVIPPVPEEPAVPVRENKPVADPDPVQIRKPEPEDVPVVELLQFDEPKTLADALADQAEAPKTLNDLIREKQEHREPDAPRPVQTPPARAAKQPEAVREAPQPAPRPVSKIRTEPAKPAPAVERSNPVAAHKKQKRSDIVLILAVIVAIAAVIAMIYAYAIVDLPLFNLQ